MARFVRAWQVGGNHPAPRICGALKNTTKGTEILAGHGQTPPTLPGANRQTRHESHRKLTGQTRIATCRWPPFLRRARDGTRLAATPTWEFTTQLVAIIAPAPSKPSVSDELSYASKGGRSTRSAVLPIRPPRPSGSQTGDRERPGREATSKSSALPGGEQPARTGENLGDWGVRAKADKDAMQGRTKIKPTRSADIVPIDSG